METVSNSLVRGVTRAVQESDPIGYQLLVQLYADLAKREDEIESALTGGQQ